MLLNPFQYLSQYQKGIIMIFAGTILLLDTLGWLTRWLDTLVIIGAIYMIAYGIFMTGMHKKVMNQ